MKFAEKFIQNFFTNYNVISVSEIDKEFECILSAKVFKSIELDKIEKDFDFLRPKDILSFTIEFGQANPVSFNSTITNFKDFKDNLNDEYIHQEGEEIRATFQIIKENIENNITIYDLDTFTKTLSELTIAQVYVIFNRVLFNSTLINFIVLNLDHSFNTQNVYFSTVSSYEPLQKISNRQKQIENVLTASNYTNIKEHNLCPDDFQIVNFNLKYNKLCLLFNHYSAILSVIYLFDITTINNNQLEFKINGYKSIKGIIDIQNFKTGIDDYYNIYNWVYSGGNLNDKIGLARNIISLHFEKSGEIELKGNSFTSIQSSYKVYEKQNIKQYIEIRNKISDQLIDFNTRANKLIETFASGFQKSGLALVTFYISAIAIRVLAKGDFSNVFSFDATMLSIAFILSSFIYYKVARWEVIVQKKRFEESYKNLKDRYLDLLDKDDIQRILNDDKEFNSDVNFIDEKLKNYSNLWKWFLIILLLTTIMLFGKYNLSKLYESQIWQTIIKTNCGC